SQGLVESAAINISLDRQGVGSCRRPIRAESSTQGIPAVVSRHTRWIYRRAPIKVLCVGSVVGVVAQLAAITNAPGCPLLCSGSSCHDFGLRGFGLLGDDIDHPIYGIGSPQRCTGA